MFRAMHTHDAAGGLNSILPIVASLPADLVLPIDPGAAQSVPGIQFNMLVEWANRLADLALFGAYTAIPLLLSLLIVRRKDFGIPGLLWLFTAFLLFCGIYHMLEAVAVCIPGQVNSTLFKLAFVVIAWGVVITIVRVTPQALEMPDITRLTEDLRQQRKEKSHVEQILSQKRALLDNIIENAPCGIYWKGLDDGCLGCNRMFAEIMGRPCCHEIVGDPCHQLCEVARATDWSDKTVIDSGVPILNEEIELESLFGRRTLLRNRVPLKDESGEIFGVLGILSDITELKTHEQALRESEQRFRGTFEQAAVGIAHVGLDGTWLRVNDKLCEILGRTREDLLETRFQDITHPEDLEADLQLARRVLGKEINEYCLEKRYLSADGSIVWAHLTVSMIWNDDGTPKHFVSVLEDISQRKLAQEQLENARRLADEANRAKGDFLAHMSHEIRTPLNGILGYAELLRRGVGTPSQQRSHLETIISSGHHLLTLIDDILDLSKIESGYLQLEQIRCSPHQIICEVLSLLRVRAQEKCLNLEAEWATPAPLTVLTDPARLRQVLVNVVGNAIKFTDKGEVRIVASVSADDVEPRFAIDVIDTGIGIPEDRQEAIFAPFSQADYSITRRFGGTGLGMSISRKIARSLGGDITVVSRVGRGSTFRITLNTGPLDDVPLTMTPFLQTSTETEPAPPKDSDSLIGLRVLLAEDGKANRELIQLILEDAGADVTVTVNGRDAIDAALREPFDIILMDMQMPILDGYSAARRIRELGCPLPIIALTAHAMRGDEEKCLAAGCSGYLAKPVDLTELIRTVAAAVPWRTDSTPIRKNLSPDSTVTGGQTGRPGIASTLPTHQPAIARIVKAFIDVLPEKIERMWQCYFGRDYESLAREAHWLKGTGGTMGFHCFTSPAQNLLDEARLSGRSNENRLEELLQELSYLAQDIRVSCRPENLPSQPEPPFAADLVAVELS